MEDEIQPYKYVVYPGNHPEVIKQGLNRRGNMKGISHELSDDEVFSEADFIWRPTEYQRKSLNELNEITKNRIIVNYI